MSEMAPAKAQYVTMIKDMPSGERPRERLRDTGAGSLSNTELLVIILRTGTVAEEAPAMM